MNRPAFALVPAIALSTLTVLASHAHAGFSLRKEKSDSVSKSNIGGSYYAGARVVATTYAEQCDASMATANAMCSLPFFPKSACDSLVDQIQATVCSQSGNILDAYAGAKLGATIFGKSFEVAKAEIYAENDNSGARAGAGLYGAGVKLWGPAVSSSVSAEILYPVFGINASKKVKIAGINVSVSARAGGFVGLYADAAATTSSLEVGGGPVILATASASAGAEVIGFGGGVSGSLTLADLRGDGRGTLEFIAANRVRVTAQFNLILEFLSGSLEVWVKMFGSKVGDWTLFSWSGWDFTLPLAEATKTWTL